MLRYRISLDTYVNKCVAACLMIAGTVERRGHEGECEEKRQVRHATQFGFGFEKCSGDHVSVPN